MALAPDHARDSFGTYQRTQERAVAYTVLAHKNVLTRIARASIPGSATPRAARTPFSLSPLSLTHITLRVWQSEPGGKALQRPADRQRDAALAQDQPDRPHRPG